MENRLNAKINKLQKSIDARMDAIEEAMYDAEKELNHKTDTVENRLSKLITQLTVYLSDKAKTKPLIQHLVRLHQPQLLPREKILRTYHEFIIFHLSLNHKLKFSL